MKKLRALDYKVIIEEKSKRDNVNGIFVPDGAENQTTLFIVVDIGKNAFLDDVSIGDTVVIVDKYAGVEIVCDGHTYRIVDDDDIVGKE